MHTQVVLALGSSIGDRRLNFRRAITELAARGVHTDGVSPAVETPALLPIQADPEWNVPYLNLVLDATFAGDDFDALVATTKAVQRSISQTPISRWAPRAIDIDVLAFGDRVIDTREKTIPNLADVSRPFNVTPLMHLAPSRVLPGFDRSVFDLTTTVVRPIPLLMGIANLTPDSFAGGEGRARADEIQRSIVQMIDDGASIIDIGGESVRPGAQPVEMEEEWHRIEAALQWLKATVLDDPLAPWISVDTRHARTAERALDLGARVINDVGGLADPSMQEVAAASKALFVVMHSLTIPPDGNVLMPVAVDPVATLHAWFANKLEGLVRRGIEPDRIIVDPGICFGKSRIQSQQLMRAIATLRQLGCRVLVGHSRKGFIRSMEARPTIERDLETTVASLAMAAGGVDFLRVHNVAQHARASLAWAHVAPDRPVG